MAQIKNNVDTKELILSCSEKFIIEDGTNSFTLKDIAKLSNLSTGTIYYYYKTKNDLVFDLLQRYMTSLKNDFDDWIVRHNDGSLTKERFIEILLLKGVKLFNKSKIRLYLINECLANNPTLKERYVTLSKEWEREIASGLKMVFPNMKNHETFAKLLMLVIDGLTVQEALNKPNYDYSEIEKLLLEFGESYE